ncbi:CBS domain-containing protein [Pseudomonas fluvialis]|uniref:CBS domain-containing protein n=1 Tax=Pseudomonas fluvialis TaxID=1793966 RepID=UPI0035AF80E7
MNAIQSHAQNSFENAFQLASTRVPRLPPQCSAGEALQAMAGHSYDCASHLVVCDDEERLLGLLRIEDLLCAAAESPLAELMDRQTPVVAPGVDQEVAAWRAVRNRESALAVVDAEGRFVGLIPPHQLLAVLLAEHEEDLSRLGCFTRTREAARQVSEEPVRRSFAQRLPWLLVGLAGALLATDLFYCTSEPAAEFIEALRRLAAAARVELHLVIAERDGRLTPQQLRERIRDWADRHLWFCGPSAFGQCLRRDLRAHGIPAGDFHQELFEMR